MTWLPQYFDVRLGFLSLILLGGTDLPPLSLPSLPPANGSSSKEFKSCHILKKIALSPQRQKEENYLFIREIFQTTRNVRPSGRQISRWMNTLGQGGTREGVYRSLVLNKVYRTLEQGSTLPNKRVLSFASEHLSEFVGGKLRPTHWRRMNFYALKRIVTDKTLEVLDVLCARKNGQDALFNWYALFSANLAKNGLGPQVWKSRIRQSTSEMEHKRWASKMSADHLKSEVIIKLHRIFNLLNLNDRVPLLPPSSRPQPIRQKLPTR